MSKLEQVLTIEPQNELRFRGPFTGAPVTSYMRLINPTNHKVYFKIKTTVPKRYCVRPNCGVLKPKEVTEIAVCLQPFDFDPSEKNKHKFMVQTLIAPEGDTDEFPLQDVWRDINPNQLMDSKLKCVFENPVTTTTTEGSPTVTTVKSDSVTTTDGKNKGIGDTVKSLSKVTSEGDNDDKLVKAVQEVNQLRVQESHLRQENLQLKEEILRLRNLTLDKDPNWADNSVKGSSQISSQLPQSYVGFAITIAMVIVGYLLGKLI